MKNQLMTGMLAAGLLAACVGVALAEDKIVTGESKCTKCALKETDSCQLAVAAEENGRKVTYYLSQNDVSKNFQSQNEVCRKPAKIKATGTVKSAGGKNELTATRIELAKD